MSVYNIVNVPTKASGIEIECKVTLGGAYQLQTSDGWIICTIHPNKPEFIADDLARIVTLARDRGFEQGRQFVRDALGIPR